ncbi:MFS general substrate transporter [Phlegmacium glaucopus]|nr:MFS general substrate transporter [Phlegmacium glaucopus]
MSKEQGQTAALGASEPTVTELMVQPTGSRFTKHEKWFIVGFTAFVGLFSPLTSTIYFPAIPSLVIAFHKSTELINLTVTMYIVLQGIAPMIWGTISDHVGRRPISAICLFILTFSCVGLALVPTSAYWLLMILRCLQAAGSASTIAIGAGVIGDISSREERGSFFGLFILGPMVGPSIGPIIGGALSDSLGWRSIFWFLCITASISFVTIILLQPETLKRIVEEGRDQIPIIYRPVIPIIGRRQVSQGPTPGPTAKVSRNPFRLFLNPDILVLLALNAIVNAVYYSIVASISSLFSTAYPFLSETKIGLCYLAIGGGMMAGSSIMGRVLDWEYQTFRRRAESRIAALGLTTADITMEEFFPLEQARLRLMPFFVLLLVSSCAGYGWAIQRQINIACPLILQFIAGFTCIALMNSTSTLMIDLVPGQSSSVTACNNFVRCTLSAVLVSVIDLIMKGIGIGWTYVLLSGFSIFALPLVYGAIKIGPRCRIKRQHLREEEVGQMAQQKD